MAAVVVLGFFANRDEARGAAVELSRRRLSLARLLGTSLGIATRDDYSLRA